MSPKDSTQLSASADSITRDYRQLLGSHAPKPAAESEVRPEYLLVQSILLVSDVLFSGGGCTRMRVWGCIQSLLLSSFSLKDRVSH